jgi:integrase
MIDVDGFREKLYEDEMSPNTVRSYVYAVQQYAAKYESISKQNLIAHKQDLMQRYRPATVNLRITALMAYCRYAGQPQKVKTVKLQRQTHAENVITQAQHDLLIRRLRADGLYHWAANIMLLSMTGMRISEAIRVTKRDISAGSVTMNTKGKMRTIYFPRKLIDEISPDLEQLGALDLVIRGCTGRPITADTVRDGLQRYADRYGIPREVMHPHSFRHFFAIQFLKRNGNIALLADLLGHSSINITRIYLQQSQGQQKGAVDDAVDWLPAPRIETPDNMCYQGSENGENDETAVNT